MIREKKKIITKLRYSFSELKKQLLGRKWDIIFLNKLYSKHKLLDHKVKRKINYHWEIDMIWVRLTQPI